MPRERLTFRQRDVTAAIKAVERAGREVASVSTGEDRSIVVKIARPGEDPEDELTPLKKWQKEHATRDSGL
jgi:hypothetical protein